MEIGLSDEIEKNLHKDCLNGLYKVIWFTFPSITNRIMKTFMKAFF